MCFSEIKIKTTEVLNGAPFLKAILLYPTVACQKTGKIIWTRVLPSVVLNTLKADMPFPKDHHCPERSYAGQLFKQVITFNVIKSTESCA
jgi:hypothetical protein